MGRRPIASARMRQAWITRRAKAAHPLTPDGETQVQHVVMHPEPNGHPTVEHRLVLRVQGTELTLNVGEARQLREALTEALPTP